MRIAGPLAIATVPWLLACAAAMPRPGARPPLGEEGELQVFMQPLPTAASSLSFSISSVSVIAPDGTVVPLEVEHADFRGATSRFQQRLASGRLPPGSYAGIQVGVRSASVARRDGRAELLVPKEPTELRTPFAVARGEAVVLQLFLRAGETVDHDYQFQPAFDVERPPKPIPTLVGLVPDTGTSEVTVVDTKRREVAGVLATGAGPQGVALDWDATHAYVAESGSDAVAVVDMQSLQIQRRVALSAGDRPRELRLTPDGRVLLVTNPGSYTVSFVDPVAAIELGRVQTGYEPSSIVMDRSGRRAYVLNGLSSNISVLDIPNRAIAATVQTDPRPLRADLSRAGDRLFLVTAESPFLTVYSVPDLAVANRVYVGLGMTFVRADPNDELLYLARSDEARLHVYDPFSLLPVDFIELPAPASWLAIDPLERTLYAVMPERRAVAVVDLTTRELLSVIEVGQDPYEIVLAQERR